MQKRQKQPAIVLLTRQLKEADIIATLLTKDLGKVSAIARGVKRSKKRFMNGLDIFDCGVFDISFIPKSDHLFHIEAFSAKESWQGIRDNLLKFSLASFLLELSESFLPEADADGSKLFEPLYRSLKAIERAESDNEAKAISIFYNLLLLEHSGVEPQENKQDISSWWRAMKETKKPILAKKQELIKSSFSFLLPYNESVLGRRLKTRSLDFSCFS